jgi:DNA polymerase elongation subunit (family B)
MKELQQKAKLLGVEHKIDMSSCEDDVAYVDKWCRLLDKFQQFKNKCNLEPFRELSLADVDEKDIRFLKSDVALFEQVKESLHEDHDGVFPEPHGKATLRPSKTTRTNTTDVEMSEKVSKDVHIIDVDYEYDYGSGMHVVLYTRVIGSDDTAFVRVPYHDYFYIEVTPELDATAIIKAVNGYAWYLKQKYEKDAIENPLRGPPRKRVSDINVSEFPLIVSTQIVNGLKSMYGYQPEDQTFVKIVTANPTVTKDLFDGLSKKYVGEEVQTYTYDNNTRSRIPAECKYFPEMRFFEAHKTDVVNKFLTQHGISGCSAIRVVGTRHGDTNPYSYCTMAIDAESIEALDNAPFYEPRTFFYDIECLSLNINEFPTSDRCPIIQISYVCVKGRTEVSKGVLCLQETPGYEWFDSEDTMLLAFAKKIVDFNPDFVTGFNSNNFDMPYIIDRMKMLRIHNIAGMFSRRKGFIVDYRREYKQSKQFGTKEVVNYVIPGRVMFDQMEIIKGNPMIRLRSYSLKSICAEYLGDDNKEDLAYREIPTLFQTTEGRQRIASYCLQDSLLLKKLDDKMMLGLDIASQARVQMITPSLVLSRGLVYRIMCKIKSYTERYGFLIPTFTKKQVPVSPTYQGATVLNCDAGFYSDPVVVLDFASLYPSLIRSYNLDYTTIALSKEQVEKYPERFQTFDNGYSFVKSEYHRGLLPRIETELVEQRNAAKKKMKQAQDPVEEAVWNSVQGGVKIVMNSIYGLCGSPTATVPCVPIASTITFLGRTNLAAAKEYVENNYCRLTGETTPSRVIYGDSVTPDTAMTVKYYDTIMVLNVRDVEREFGVGKWVIMRDGDDKESLELKDGLFSWTEIGWTKMERMIRHFCRKDVVAVSTHSGFVKCTVDHSLVTESGDAVQPKNCVINKTRLLHAPFVRTANDVQTVYDVTCGSSLSGGFDSVYDYAVAMDKTTCAVHNMIAKGIINWVNNIYHVALNPMLASVMGMFVGDGSCGEYEMKRGFKYSWAINNSDPVLIDKYKSALEACFPFVGFKILDTMASSRVFKLVPHSNGKKGVIRDFVLWWRKMCYHDNGEKKVPVELYNASQEIQRAFLKGIYDSDGTKSEIGRLEVSLKGERVCQGVTTLAYLCGHQHVVIDTRPDKPHMFRLRTRTSDELRKHPHVLKKVAPVQYIGYVYDFTTENHHFHAGVGDMIVHNTDSIFILMPGVDVTTAIKYGQLLDDDIKNHLFGHLECLVMEYEKVYKPFIQVTPKRYAGYKMEFDANKGKFAASGLQLVNRDSALLCKKTMQTFFDYLLVKNDKEKALESLKLQIADLFTNQLPLEDFEITKKISKRPEDYKTVPPHIAAWSRMVRRVGVTSAPAVGERFPFVVTKFGKHDKMADAIVDTPLVMEKGFEKFNLAKEHYFNLYIYNPMHVIVELVYGKEVAQRVLDPRSYEHIETVSAKNGNILGFFGVESHTRKRKVHGLGVDEQLLQEIRQLRLTDMKVIDESSDGEEEEGGDDE